MATDEPQFLIDGPAGAPITVVLAHGAGAPMDHPFMQTVAAGLASSGLRVARFEFAYMRRRRDDGSRRPPDRPPVLLEAWRAVIEALGGGANLVIGGKSMGGRIASLIADEASVAGLVCLGYPFHPAGKPDRLRTEHLATLRTPTLILQGERDVFGSRAEVATYDLAPAIEVHWLPDGDHSLRPRKRSGRTVTENLQAAVDLTAGFVARVSSASERARRCARVCSRPGADAAL